MRRKKKKKKKDGPYPEKEIKDKSRAKGDASSIHKNSTDMNILISLYDLFTLLDPIFNFAKYVMQVSFFYPLP
jgi:hypothetical protein